MLGYATLGSNDLEKAKAFYDKVLAPLGGQRAFGSDRMQGYASAAGGGMLAVCRPYDEKAASAGNGTMIALAADSREKVDEVYKVALANALGARAEPPSTAALTPLASDADPAVARAALACVAPA